MLVDNLLKTNKEFKNLKKQEPQSIFTEMNLIKLVIQKFRETEDIKYIYRNELDKACFQHNMAYGDFKDLTRRTASDKVVRDKAFNIAEDPKYDGYQRGLASMV